MLAKLKLKRMQRGWTQTKFASFLGVSPLTYCRYENEKIELTKSTIDRILEIFDCKYEDIFREDD